MKNYISLTLFHTKRMLTTIPYLVISVLLPLLFIIFIHFIGQREGLDGSFSRIEVVSQSSFVNEEVKPFMKEEDQKHFVEDLDLALKNLENRDTNIVYSIPENFPEDAIQVYSLNGKNTDPVWEKAFQSTLLQVQEKKVLEKHGLQAEDLSFAIEEIPLEFKSQQVATKLMVLAIMVILYMGMTAMITASDLASMRKYQVLKRSIIANSNSGVVLGSILIGYTLAGLICSSFTIIAGSLIMQTGLGGFPRLFILVLTMSFFLAGLNIFLFRYIQDINIIRVLGSFLPMLFMGLSMAGKVNPNLSFLEKFSPFYWLFDSLDTGIMIPNIPIVLLFGAILFTAGSFKLERLLSSKN